MGGIALKRFNEKKTRVLIVEKDRSWPALWKLVEKGVFLEIDYFITEQILSKNNYPLEIACLVCSVVAVSRLGSLCLKLDGLNFEPPMDEWIEDDVLRNYLQEQLQKALLLLNEEFFLEHSALCIAGNRIYLSANFSLEANFVDDLMRLLKDNKESLELPELSAFLNDEQKKALEICFAHRLSLLTGGPGTGKTFTAAHIVKAFLEKKGNDARIIVAAPTGKAAAHLESSIRKVLGVSPNSMRSATLHSLLQIRSTAHTPSSLVADLIIVDECSMIDSKMFSYFLSALQKETKVLLMGDKDQLPAVESGSFFADLVQAASDGFDLPCALLQRSMRSDEKGILELAGAIKRGDNTAAIKHLKEKTIDLGLEPSQIFAYAKDFFPASSDERPDPINLLKRLNDIAILCPVRKGSQGVDSINAFFIQNLRIKGKWLASPILITRTDYNLGLYNGDTGVLLCKGEERIAYFLDKEGNPFSLNAELLPTFEYAYCLSVHKSQGSEYASVLLLLPPSSEHFGKEMLYTAVTRVKNELKIAASLEMISACLQRDSRKISGLCERLKSWQGVY